MNMTSDTTVIPVLAEPQIATFDREELDEQATVVTAY